MINTKKQKLEIQTKIGGGDTGEISQPLEGESTKTGYTAQGIRKIIWTQRFEAEEKDLPVEEDKGGFRLNLFGADDNDDDQQALQEVPQVEEVPFLKVTYTDSKGMYLYPWLAPDADRALNRELESFCSLSWTK